MKNLNSIAIVFCLSASGLLLAGQDQEQKLKTSEVPAAVTAAASKQYPKAKISHWSKEMEDGKTTYEASVVEGSSKRDVVLAEDGTLVAVEETIAASALPGPVTSAVQEKYPQAVIAKAEKITKDGDVQYEVALRKASKKEVLLTADGKVIKEE